MSPVDIALEALKLVLKILTADEVREYVSQLEAEAIKKAVDEIEDAKFPR